MTRHSLKSIGSVVLGYHGTSREYAEMDMRTGHFHKSVNKGDWLGHGIYFWENNPRRAVKWALDRYKNNGVVIKASVKLSRCLDLTNSFHTQLLVSSYHQVKERYESEGFELPENNGEDHALDCLVINNLTQNMYNVDTILCPFYEGDPVFPGSNILEHTHMQLVVVNDEVIEKPLEMEYGEIKI